MTPDPAEVVREARKPDWNDVRRRRVFQRIQDERFRQRDSAWWRWMLSGGLVTAAVAALLFLWSTPQTPKPESIATVTTPEATPGAIWLSDGIAANVFADAELSLLERSTRRVAVGQTRGAVRYEVEPGKKSAFEVTMQGVTVRVLGTIFEVSARGRLVRVGVERGRVQVTHLAGVSVLEAGQSGEFYGVEKPAATGDPALADTSVDVVPAEEPTKTAARPRPAIEQPSARELLRLADQARRDGEDRAAAGHLRTLLRIYPRDPQAVAARFTLGRIETARKRYLVAAKQFQLARQSAPEGPLAEDSLAEEAWTRYMGRQRQRASELARRYLEQYPSGPNRERMQGLVDGSEQ